MKTTTYKDVLEVNASLNKCVSKGLPVEAVLSLIDFKDELQAKIEKYQRVFKDIMAEYEVSEENGVFNWSDHAKVEEVSTKVTDLINASVDLKVANFLNDAAFVQITDGMTLGELSFLRKFLKKD